MVDPSKRSLKKPISKKNNSRSRARKSRKFVNDISCTIQSYYRMENLSRMTRSRQQAENEERKAQDVARNIVDTILTLRCPNRKCQKAFLDFDGCFTLECHQCGVSFCAWCVRFNDWNHGTVHQHVDRCDAASRAGTQHPFYIFVEHQRERRRTLVINRLRHENQRTVRRVLDIINTNLEELGINISITDLS